MLLVTETSRGFLNIYLILLLVRKKALKHFAIVTKRTSRCERIMDVRLSTLTNCTNDFNVKHRTMFKCKYTSKVLMKTPLKYSKS